MTKIRYPQNALINNDNLPLYGQHTEYTFHEAELHGFKTEASSVHFTCLERRLTEMVWQDDSSGLISLVKQTPDHSQESPCLKEDEGLDPNFVAKLLQLACKLDSVKCAQVIVEGQIGAVVKINEMDEFGRSPLHNAAEMLSAKCIDLLLRNHAHSDLRSKDVDALLPLEIALASQRIHVNWSPIESVEELLVSLKDMDLNAIKFLAEATENLRDLSYMMAVKGQVIELASLLLVGQDKVKGSVTIQGKSNLSSERNKTMYGHVLEELLKLLEMAKDGQYQESIHRIHEKRQALLCQIELLHLFGVDSIICCGDKKVFLPLLLASQAGDELLVEVLLKQNMDVNDTNEDGNSSLHCFLKGDATSQNPRILLRLLNHGARVNEHNKLGLTPFHLASLKCNYKALKILLLHAPECVDILSVTNETPLFLAVKNNSINCVKLLLQFGASRDALNLRRQRPIDLAASEEMRNILRTVYPITLDCNKLFQDAAASCPLVEESSEGMLKSFLEQKNSKLSKKNESKELDEKVEICRYFRSPNGCVRGSKCYYSHGGEAQRIEKSGLPELKPRVLSYNKDSASLEDDLNRKIFVGGLPPSVDSVDLKKFFEEEFGPVEDAIVIVTKDGGRVLSKGYGFLTFKQEDTKKIAMKTQFITLSGKAVKIKNVVSKCRIAMETSSSLSDHKIIKNLDVISDMVPFSKDSNDQQLFKISDLPQWLVTFKKWLPAYLNKACKRLGEGTWYPLSSLKGDFRATCGMELDHEPLGFLRLSDFLRSLPGICRMQVISAGNGSPTHMVLQPFYSSSCKKPRQLEFMSSSDLLSSSSGVLSPTHSPSIPELSDIISFSNESLLQESVSVNKKAGLLDGIPNFWMWEHMPNWLVKPGSRGVGFLEYNLWKSVGVPEEETAAEEKAQQPFSFFVHQWDSGLLSRGYCAVCKRSMGIYLIGVCPYKICHSCKKDLCNYFDGIQLQKPAGFKEEFPSLGESGLSSHLSPSSSIRLSPSETSNREIS